MVHHLPTVYIRRIDASAAEELAPGLAENVAKDLDWLEAELKRCDGRYLVGDHVTAADTMVAFSIQFIFWLRLAPQGGKWEGIEAWLRKVEAHVSEAKSVCASCFISPGISIPEGLMFSAVVALRMRHPCMSIS